LLTPLLFDLLCARLIEVCGSSVVRGRVLIGSDRTLKTLLVTKNKSPVCALACTRPVRLLYAADRLTASRDNEFLLKKALERVHTCAICKLGFPCKRCTFTGAAGRRVSAETVSGKPVVEDALRQSRDDAKY